jgi:hypothetical protein
MVYQLKITLKGIKPPIWRRVLVPATATLNDLHAIVQVAMGWDDSHLHQFEIGKQRYSVRAGDEFDDGIDETRTRLDEVIRPRMKFVYEYDFGDDWIHEIIVEKKLDDDERVGAFCTGGERACPPEDSGGIWGYEEKLEILADPKREDYQELLDWIGPEFDPEAFDVEVVNKQLVKIAVPKKKRARKTHR